MHRLAAMSFLEPAAHSRVSIGDVRFGSKADIREHVRNVRFTPESGHRAERLATSNLSKWSSVIRRPAPGASLPMHARGGFCRP